MRIINTLNPHLFSGSSQILQYWNSDLLENLYFSPKAVHSSRKGKAISDPSFLKKIERLSNFLADSHPDLLCEDMIRSFEEDTEYTVGEQCLYLILGCNTTTIYTTEYLSKEVSVLCMESLNGNPDMLKMLLAHEFTHLIRKQFLQKDIFDSCIGERIVTEGIAENYSREAVPGMKESDYCLVNTSCILWVQNHMEEMKTLVKDNLSNSSLMKDLFYMFAEFDYPVRSGYVYGYLAVKQYLEKNNLSVRDILSADWQIIMGEVL